MRRTCAAFFAAIAVTACGQGADDSAKDAPPVSAIVAGDPCALVVDAAGVFGREVTAANEPMPNMCQWSSPDAIVSGSIIVQGAGWSAVTDAQAAYDQMLETMVGVATEPVFGLGDQAAATSMGDSHTQIFFRKGGVAVNVGASSSDPTLSSAVLADRIARAAADRL